ncbi:hypothetical protein ACFQ60_03445 [Streptomyces zhihengii]
MAVVEAPSLYPVLGALYERELDAHGIGAMMLTHKWQPADLLAPHSDIDVRVLLSQPPTDWEEWNHRLAAAHTSAVGREISHRRLLEHPPGFAFTVAEADGRLVSAPELATWSLISGSARDFQRWKSRAQMASWCDVDERFYRGSSTGGWAAGTNWRRTAPTTWRRTSLRTGATARPGTTWPRAGSPPPRSRHGPAAPARQPPSLSGGRTGSPGTPSCSSGTPKIVPMPVRGVRVTSSARPTSPWRLRCAAFPPRGPPARARSTPVPTG